MHALARAILSPITRLIMLGAGLVLSLWLCALGLCVLMFLPLFLLIDWLNPASRKSASRLAKRLIGARFGSSAVKPSETG